MPHWGTSLDFVIWVLIIVVYFVPALVAKQRDTENVEAIFLVNLVFGWTVLGWIAGLIWAIVEEVKVKSAIDSSYAPTADAAQTETLPDAMRWGPRIEKRTDAGKSIF